MSALAGVRVVELARILAGPWIGQTLADLGADVIKVESPEGDDTRRWGPPFIETGGRARGRLFSFGCNRGKRSIVADFATERGREIVRRLAARSDVLIENFKVGGLAKFGLDYESLTRLNPRLIYCSLTGFGQTGPYAERAGYDFLIQGMSGYMDVTGDPDGEPQKVGVAVCRPLHRALRRHRDRSGADRARAHRARPADRPRALRHDGRDARQPGDELSRLGRRAAPHGQRASEHRALSDLSRRRRLCDRGGRQRRAIRASLRDARPRCAGRDERFATNAARVANRSVLERELAARRATGDATTSSPRSKRRSFPPGRSTRSQTSSPIRNSCRAACRSTRKERRASAVPIVMSESPLALERRSPKLGEHEAEILREIGLA